MDIRASILDFLFIEHLTWVDDFSPSVDSGAFVDHYNDLKSCSLVRNLIVEFNVLSISGLRVEIDKSCVEIPLSFSLENQRNHDFSEKSKNLKF